VEISPSGSASQSIHTPTSSRLGSGDDDEERPSYFRHSSQNLILSPDEQGMTKLPAERDAVGHIEYKVRQGGVPFIHGRADHFANVCFPSSNSSHLVPSDSTA
jgi:hypothetical protein